MTDKVNEEMELITVPQDVLPKSSRLLRAIIRKLPNGDMSYYLIMRVLIQSLGSSLLKMMLKRTRKVFSVK